MDSATTVDSSAEHCGALEPSTANLLVQCAGICQIEPARQKNLEALPGVWHLNADAN